MYNFLLGQNRNRVYGFESQNEFKDENDEHISNEEDGVEISYGSDYKTSAMYDAKDLLEDIYLIKRQFHDSGESITIEAIQEIKEKEREIIGTISLLKGKDLDFRFSDERETLVMIAAKSGSFDITKYLLRKGANANLRDINGNNALMSAAESGNLMLVTFLYASMRQLESRDRNGTIEVGGNINGNVENPAIIGSFYALNRR